MEEWGAEAVALPVGVGVMPGERSLAGAHAASVPGRQPVPDPAADLLAERMPLVLVVQSNVAGKTAPAGTLTLSDTSC